MGFFSSIWSVRNDSQTYLVDSDNLTGGLLHLTQAAHEVPEARLGDRLVDGEEAHAVQSGVRLPLRRQVPTDNQELGVAAHGSARLVRVQRALRSHSRCKCLTKERGDTARTKRNLRRPSKTICNHVYVFHVVSFVMLTNVLRRILA